MIVKKNKVGIIFCLLLILGVIFPYFIIDANALSSQKLPSSASNDASVGTTAWTNPTNAETSNNVYASWQDGAAGGGRESNRLIVNNFGFAIPAGNSITGVVVDVERWWDNSGNVNNAVVDGKIQLMKNNVVNSTNLGTSRVWTGTCSSGCNGTGVSENFYSYGSSSNLWGETLHPADINSANFGFGMTVFGQVSSGTNPIAHVDVVRITVFYTPAIPSAPTLTKANTISTTQIQPKWQSSVGATWYLVKQESPIGGGFSQIANVTTLNYNNTGLTAGTQYNYEIFAGNSSGTSGASNTVANYTTANPPTSLTFSSITTTTGRVSWTAPTGNGTVNGYKIEKESPIGGGFSTVVSNTGNSTLHYDFTSLAAGTQYNVRISTVYGSSNSVSAPSTANKFYTLQVAPTGLKISSTSNTALRLTWTNPSGNLTGFKIEKESPIGGGFSTVISNTNNSTNHYDNTGLTGNTQYNYRVSTNSGSPNSVSSASTTSNNYTLPSPPTNLQIVRNVATQIRITWTAPVDNGTVNGYKIEFSTNGGSSWSTASANTGNSTLHYDHTALSASLGYTYRISTLQYSGTSPPSANSPTSFWKQVTFKTFENDGTTILTGSVYQSNKTSSNNIFSIVSGNATITGVLGLQNYTLKDAVTNLFVLKSYNQNSSLALPTSLNANVIQVDCPNDGAGNDFKIETNETNGQRISSITPITCSSSDLVTWNETFTGDGKSSSSFNSLVELLVSNSNYQANAQNFSVNGTAVGTSYDSVNNIMTSSPFTVGLGTKTYLEKFSMQLQCICPQPPAGGSGGGGGSPLSIIPTNETQSILGLSVKGYNFQGNLGEIENGTITIQWSTSSDLSITSLDAGTFSNWIAFPQTPLSFQFKQDPTIITIPIVLHIPTQGCDPFRGITINCAENKLYSIPVTINAKLGDTSFSTVANITVNTLNSQSYGLITALSIFGIAISAFVIRGTSLGKRLKRSKRRDGEFLNKLKDW